MNIIRRIPAQGVGADVPPERYKPIAMPPDKVELVAQSLSTERRITPGDISSHLEAARAKLTELQLLRRRKDAELAELRTERSQAATALARCVDELDAARLEIDRLKAAQGEHAVAVYKVQQVVIKELEAQLGMTVAALRKIAAAGKERLYAPGTSRYYIKIARDALEALSVFGAVDDSKR